MKRGAILGLFEEALKQRIGSGIAAAYGTLDAPHSEHDFYLGTLSHIDPVPVSPESIFDLASLSKILATTLLSMKEVETSTLSLDARLENLLPARVAANSDLKGIRVRDLLTHGSGLPAWRAFYEDMRVRFGSNLPFVDTETRKCFFDNMVFESKRENPIAKKAVYSDIGMLILEHVLASGAPPANAVSLFQAKVEDLWAQVPEMNLHYRPVLTDTVGERIRIRNRGESVVATEDCPWRGLVVGQVHDDNSWTRGGVSAHAGVFGTLNDIKLWIQALMNETWVTRSTIREFSREWVDEAGVRRGIGFDLPPRDGTGSTGTSFSQNTIGHLGFTGTSLWIDLDTGSYAVLLTNRVHPNRNDIRIRKLRQAFHTLVRS